MQQLIKSFADKLNGDNHLFDVVDLRLPDEEKKVVVVTGEQAYGFLLDGHYHVTYRDVNPASRKNKQAEALAKVKEAHGEVALPKPAAQLLEEKEAEIAALKLEMEKLQAGGKKAPKEGGKADA